MKNLVHLSRAFVEFGPFTKKEILDFQKRGLLADTDYLRNEGTEEWLHCQEWLDIVHMPPAKTMKKPAPGQPAAAPLAKKARKVA